MGCDVFISYKNTTSSGKTTRDRDIAQKLYRRLRAEHIDTFFSEKDLSSAAFMDEIYGALDKASVLILVGTSAEHINSRWVKSEWQNFLGAINSERKPDGAIITLLDGMTTRELPIELAHYESFRANNIDSLVTLVNKILKKKKAAAAMADDLHLDQLIGYAKGENIRIRIKKGPAQAQAAPQSDRAAVQDGRELGYIRAVETVREQLLNAPDAPSEALTRPRTTTGKVSYGRFEFSYVKEGAELIGYHGADSELTIPDTYKGVPVVSIGSRAFKDNLSLTSVVIPDSVTKIGVSAFNGCKNLAEVYIPDSVTLIDSCVFSGCSSLYSIVIPKNAKKIYRDTFRGCTALQSVSVPSSLRHIGIDAFRGCTALTRLEVLGDNNVDIYGDEIPTRDCQIFEHAFRGCRNLASVSIPSGIRWIEPCAFPYAKNLTITAPHNPEYYFLHHYYLTMLRIKKWIVCNDLS